MVQFPPFDGDVIGRQVTHGVPVQRKSPQFTVGEAAPRGSEAAFRGSEVAVRGYVAPKSQTTSTNNGWHGRDGPDVL